jgi:hypothetical protein
VGQRGAMTIPFAFSILIFCTHEPNRLKGGKIYTELKSFQFRVNASINEASGSGFQAQNFLI